MKKVFLLLLICLAMMLSLTACNSDDTDKPSDGTSQGGNNGASDGDTEHTHTIVTDEAVAPTCTETGLTEGKHCSVCSEVIIAQTTVDALGHTEVTDEAVAPTCTETGLTEGKHCSVCSEVILAQTTVDALGHTEVTDEAVAPTCTETGLTEGKHCSVCSEVTLPQTTVDALGHTEVTDEAVAPTCTETGLTEGKHCSVCSEVIVAQTAVDALGHTEVTDEAVAPTCTETGLTEGKHCSVCSEVTLAQEVVKKLDHVYSEKLVFNATHHYFECECGNKKDEAEHISSGPATATSDEVCTECGYVIAKAVGINFKTLTVNGSNVYGKVASTTEMFSFINEIEAVGGAKYIVSFNVTGTDDIPTKTIELEVGDNKFYVTEIINDEPTAIYTVIIRRRPVYEVTFDTKGGTPIDSITAEEDSVITAPTTTTTRAGYMFEGWSYDFTAPVSGDTTITAIWKANTDTKYTVEYYLENLTKTDYELEETDTLEGTTDTLAEAVIKSFEHFTHNAEWGELSGNIDGNGNLVLKVYYTRNEYTVTTSVSNTKGGSVTPGGTYPYGTEITLVTTVKPGYTANAYSADGTLLKEGDTYTFTLECDINLVAEISANTDTKYTVEYYLENLTKTDYELEETDTLEGTTDTLAEAVIKSFEHFTHNAEWGELSGNIDGNGNLVLKVYYTRNKYTVTLGGEGGSLIGAGAYPYGTEVTLKASPNLGYEFIGWYSDDKPISSEATYAFTIESDINIIARYSVKEEMSNFNFTSTATACDITGIKDKSVTEIIVPDYVTSIGGYAFKDCDSLTSVTIPNSVTSIGSSAFYSCDSLTSVTIGNGVTSIGSSAFSGCTGLTSVTIPDSVTSIGSFAFYSCDSLTSVTIGNGVTSIGSSAFSDCYELVEVINKSSLNITAGSSDYGCVGYRAKVVHKGESLIVNKDGYLFITSDDGTNYLVAYTGDDTELILPDNYNGKNYVINDHAFYDCDNLTSVTIPDSVTSIGQSAFLRCDSLTSVTIGNSVTSIGDSAFEGCTELTSVTIGNGVTSISDWAFYDCISLTRVYITDIAKWCDITFEHYYANPLYYAKNLYLNGNLVTELVIPDGVTSIGDYAFYNCTSLTSVTIPDSVTTIGSAAFRDCSSLTNVTIPDSVTSIGSWAFAYCDSLTSVTIGNGVTSIGSYAFAYCDSLTSVTIPDSVTSIGWGAFSGCTGLTSVTIPDSVTSIGDWAFYNCTGLTSVTIPDSVTSIGESAFYNCTGLTSVTIPGSVTSIGSSAFRGCTGLTSVTIGNSVTSIGDDAFRSCTGLTSVTIGNSVTSIGRWAFLGCTGLTSVTFENPNGWWYASSSSATSGMSITGLDDAETAAKYLRSTYYEYYWKRG